MSLQLVDSNGKPLQQGTTISERTAEPMNESEKLNFIIDCWDKERQGAALKRILKVAELVLKQVDEEHMNPQLKLDNDDSLIMIRSMRLGLMEADKAGHQ